jgi:hypothetical protein
MFVHFYPYRFHMDKYYNRYQTNNYNKNNHPQLQANKNLLGKQEKI